MAARVQHPRRAAARLAARAAPGATLPRMVRIGVDLGGTKTEIAALGPDGRVLLRRRAPTPPDYAGAIALVGGLVEAAEAELGARARSASASRAAFRRPRGWCAGRTPPG